MNPDPYNYHLPANLIAQTPARPRDSSRLLLINRRTGRLSHHSFSDLPRLLTSTDVLVFNNTRVFPARLHGWKVTGGRIELLLLKQTEKNLWEVISRPGIRAGQQLIFKLGITASVISPSTVKFSSLNLPLLAKIGETPLPPYIKSTSSQSLLRRQYQTVYADPGSVGSAAAPTAGLHFTPRLLKKLAAAGYQTEYLTLHVGLGTFKSPTAQQLASGKLHSEWFTLSPGTAARLNQAKSAGRRIITVGTTTCRVLETCTDKQGRLIPRTGLTDIFIKPPYKFRFIDGLITNFHLPQTSLLMLVSAFASWPIIRNAYHEAIRLKYRFYSFGDACLII